MFSSILYLTKILLPNIPEDDGGICLMEVYGVFSEMRIFFRFRMKSRKKAFFGSFKYCMNHKLVISLCIRVVNTF